MRVIFSIFVVLIATVLHAQQEQMYTQFMFNKLAINPAFAGNERYTGFTGLYRDQWNGFPGSPTAQVFSVNLPRIGEKIGVGMNLRRQTIGIHSNTTYSGIYSYKFPFENSVLSMGIEVSGRNFVTDFTDSRLVAIQGLQNDPSIPQERIVRNLLNVGYGIYYNTNTFYFGASVPRLIRADIDFDSNEIPSEEVRHVFLMGGVAFPIDGRTTMSIQSMMRFAENSPFSTDLSGMFTIDEKYNAGLNYRFGGGPGDVGESVAFLISFQLSHNFMLGFAQEFTLSKIRSYDNGSIEIFAHYALGKKKSRVVVINPRYF
jgi:type IX secretion system PorP/SprF family membrane protein